MVQSMATQRQQNQYWLSSVFDKAASQPFRVEWATTMESDYTKVTADELSVLAKQYLNNDKALQIIGVCDGKCRRRNSAKEKVFPSPAEPEPQVHDRLSRAGMLLFQGFAPNPTYYAPKIFV
jgi:hypothetical protein